MEKRTEIERQRVERRLRDEAQEAVSSLSLHEFGMRQQERGIRRPKYHIFHAFHVHTLKRTVYRKEGETKGFHEASCLQMMNFRNPVAETQKKQYRSVFQIEAADVTAFFPFHTKSGKKCCRQLAT